MQTGTVDVGGSPTSVVISKNGALALVVVDTTEDLTAPSGLLAVVDLKAQRVRARLDLGGQPDSISLSPDGLVAAVAMEDQRDEDVVVDGVEGGLPQLPAGFLNVIDLDGPPATWTADRVELTGLPGAAFPADPEPEFVDIDADHRAVVTLQENNAVAVVDLGTRTVTSSFSAGNARRVDADLLDDDVVSFTQPLTAPREPDGVQWTRDGNLVTADEGDLAENPAGGRGWTVFSTDGDILYRSRGSAERALAKAGRYPDGRSDSKGAELEGANVALFGGQQYVFLGSERGNAVLVYSASNEAAPQLRQVLPTGEAPEGLLSLPGRGLFLTANEGDGTLSIFRRFGPPA